MVLVLDLEDLVVVDSDPAPGQDLPAQDPAVEVLILLEGLVVQDSGPALALALALDLVRAREDLEDQDLVPQAQVVLAEVDLDLAPVPDLPVQDLAVAVSILLEGLGVQDSGPALVLALALDLVRAREDLEDQDLVPQVQEDLVEADSGRALGQDLLVQDPAVEGLVAQDRGLVQEVDPVVVALEGALTQML